MIIASIALGGLAEEISSQVKISVASWILNAISTTYLICNHLITIGEATERINQVLFSTARQLIFITLIGIIIMLATSVALTLYLEH